MAFDNSRRCGTDTTFRPNTIELLQTLEFAPDFSKNGKLHRTGDYEENNFVVRRGEVFSFGLRLTDDSSEVLKNGKITFELRTGKSPSRRNGTLIEVSELDTDELDEFTYWFKETSRKDDYATFDMCIPSNALVSSYELVALARWIKQGDMAMQVDFTCNQPLYVLFNPWNESDETFMDDEDLLNEYVLNDTGYVFTSGHRAKPWNFAQFSESALKCTFQLLESAPRVSMRDSAREAARWISAKCNSNNNNGLLSGNWSGDYSGGTEPWVWAGSKAIFKEYLESGRPVKYGQCWVFSGLTTSMMRCLGIPARSVTNYGSAHDRDGNCTDDRYFDEEGNDLGNLTGDSVWNFHVWNDVWMSRPDLPDGMGGWQAIDGTPQEESDGIYQCGPAPLQAIKEGQVQMAHDTRFIFAEVNADRVNWVKYANGEVKATQVYPNSIGTALLTKAPNQRAIQDVMNEYKYAEGSNLERAVMRSVMKKVKNPVVVDQPTEISFNVRAPVNFSPGDDASLKFKVYAKNKKYNPLTTTITVVPHIIRYNGVKMLTLDKMTKECRVSGFEEVSAKFVLDTRQIPEEMLDENVSIRLSVFAKVTETGQTWISEELVNTQKADLELELVDGGHDGHVKSRGKMNVMIYLPNLPNGQQFTDAYLLVESPLVEDSRIPLSDSEANEGSLMKQFDIGFFWREKSVDFNVTFNSKQVKGVSGSIPVTVEPSWECRDDAHDDVRDPNDYSGRDPNDYILYDRENPGGLEEPDRGLTITENRETGGPLIATPDRLYDRENPGYATGGYCG